jgi:ketosteroid isomerase-like protein
LDDWKKTEVGTIARRVQSVRLKSDRLASLLHWLTPIRQVHTLVSDRSAEHGGPVEKRRRKSSLEEEFMTNQRMHGDSAAAPELVELLGSYQQAWADGDIEAILSMTPPDGVYEASRGGQVWGERYVGHDEIRNALVAMGLDRPGRSRHEYGETHVVGECGFAMWTSVQDGPEGSQVTMHGADFYRFRAGMVAAKIAYRKTVQS